MHRTSPLAIYGGARDGNSTAKISARLANAFAARGIATHLLVTHSRNPVYEVVEPGVRVIEMGKMASFTGVLRMAAYLRRERPVAVLTHRIRENALAHRAVGIAQTATPIFVTVHGPMGVKLDHLRRTKQRKRRAEFLRYYPKSGGIIAISEETAADLRQLLGAGVRLTVIPNPVVTGDLDMLANEPLAHPWFGDRIGVPVVVFAGRFEREKDLPTLLGAFALLCQTRDVRLVLIGDGSLRPDIDSLRRNLGLDARVDMPGWAANPYPYLKQADLVVLSSIWDALPTVLIEALALGTPVVSTACSAGTREILDEGRFGELVPPRNPEVLAQAMGRALDHPLPTQVLRSGAARYEVRRNADLYLSFMLGPSPDGAPRDG
jgi:glycosyltransferase involved in cell wall biosynthesis